MGGQLSYSYQTPKGMAGGLMDLAPYDVRSRINGETVAGALKFGMGAVQGTTPGTDILVPTADDTAPKFEGLILTQSNEMDMAGVVKIPPRQTVSVLRYGNAWARITTNAAPAYGAPLYLVNDGVDAGLFTTDDGGGDYLAVNGRFIGGRGTGDIAPVELYNQLAQV